MVGGGDFQQRLGELRSRKQEVSFLLEVASRRGQMRRCTAKEMDEISGRMLQRSRERFELDWKRARERNHELVSAIRETLTLVDKALGPTEASRELKLAELDVYLQAASLEPSYLDSMASRLEHLEAEKQAVVKVAKEREAAALRNLQVEARLSAKMVSLADTKRQSAERLAELEARRAANAKRDAELVQMLKQQTADAERLKAAATRELSFAPRDGGDGLVPGSEAERGLDEVLGAAEYRSDDEKEMFDVADDVESEDQGEETKEGRPVVGEEDQAGADHEKEEEEPQQREEQRALEGDQKEAKVTAYPTEHEVVEAAAEASESDEEDSIDDALAQVRCVMSITCALKVWYCRRLPPPWC